MSRTTLSKLPIATRTLIVLGVSILFAACGCLLACAALFASEDPIAHVSLCGEGAFVLTMLFCGCFGAKISAQDRFLSGMLGASVLLLFIIVLSVIFGGTSFVREVLLALLGAFFAATGALLGSREKKRRRKSR